MLSKLIYRFVAIAFFAFSAQLGMSQNYVDAAQARVILTDAIDELQGDLDNGTTYTGFMQTQDQLNSVNTDRIDLQLMKSVRRDIKDQNDVKTVMDVWYEKSEMQIAERKTKLFRALEKVKDLLSS